MSQEEQDRIAGSMARRYGEAKKHLALVKVECARVAGVFATIAGVLGRNPQDATFDGDAVVIPNLAHTAKEPTQRVDLSDLDLEKVRALTEEAASASAIIAELGPKLKALGMLE